MKLVISLICFLFLLTNCEVKNRYNDLSSYSTQNKRLQTVIEVSAGSSRYFEYDYKTNVFKIRKINGMDEMQKFLPCPVNVGFIPSSSRDSSHSRINPLDVLVITETLSPSSLLEIKVLGVMKLIENGVERNYIISEPYSDDLKILKAKDFADLIANHSISMDIIQKWFVNFKPELKTKFVSWGNENEAMKIINISLLK